MHALDLPRLAQQGVPVLCIDTCSLLDIMRDPTRDDARPHERQAACDLVGALERREFNCVVAEQVSLEFAGHDEAIQSEAKGALIKLQKQVERTNRVHSVFASPVAISMGHLHGQVSAARNIVGRWMAAAHLVTRSDAALARAMDRVNRNIAPARRGKDSMKDCLVLETYLEAIAELRARNMPASIVFLSSNTKEYLGERQLKPEIALDFLRLNVSYAPNMAAAKQQLGF